MRAGSPVVVMSALLLSAPAAIAQPGASPAPPQPPKPKPTDDVDPATVKPEDMPEAIRMRRLEQRTQALKERTWQLKARVQMLREQMLGGGAGAQAVIAHSNAMGSTFRLISITYTLDGTQVFARSDDAGESLYKTKSFDVFSGPIAPGSHSLAAQATYRGHGYGVFEYLSQYTFTAKGTQPFTVDEGKVTKIACRGYEKGGPTMQLEKRPALDCKVTTVAQPSATGSTTTATPSPIKPAPAPVPAPTPAKEK